MNKHNRRTMTNAEKRTRAFKHLGIIALLAVLVVFGVNLNKVTASEPVKGVDYMVQENDTLWGIVEKHFDNVDIREKINEIKQINPDATAGSKIIPGSRLLIPGATNHSK